MYLKMGDIHRLGGASPLLGVKDGVIWLNLTLRFSTIFGLGNVIFLLLTARPDVWKFTNSLSILPYALVTAGLNAFNKEFTLRAAPSPS
jgi:hypothetical protein